MVKPHSDASHKIVSVKKHLSKNIMISPQGFRGPNISTQFRCDWLSRVETFRQIPEMYPDIYQVVEDFPPSYGGFRTKVWRIYENFPTGLFGIHRLQHQVAPQSPDRKSVV